jgi:hypothetical protein
LTKLALNDARTQCSETFFMGLTVHSWAIQAEIKEALRASHPVPSASLT